MGMQYIPPYIHRCVVPSGPLAGNKHEHEVTAADLLYGGCEVCNDIYADTDTIVAHIYAELIKVHG